MLVRFCFRNVAFVLIFFNCITNNVFNSMLCCFSNVYIAILALISCKHGSFLRDQKSDYILPVHKFFQ